jgi:DNA-binding NtrC family response regulator
MILLVEDEQVVREFVYRVLTRSGYGVHAFVEPRGAVAFSQAHRSAIDLVLTDVVLPGIDGRTMAREILAGHPEAKVLYMSGYTDTAIVDHGVLEPDMWFIQKPFTASALLRKLRELLDHRERDLVDVLAPDGRVRSR